MERWLSQQKLWLVMASLGYKSGINQKQSVGYRKIWKLSKKEKKSCWGFMSNFKNHWTYHCRCCRRVICDIWRIWCRHDIVKCLCMWWIRWCGVEIHFVFIHLQQGNLSGMSCSFHVFCCIKLNCLSDDIANLRW